MEKLREIYIISINFGEKKTIKTKNLGLFSESKKIFYNEELNLKIKKSKIMKIHTIFKNTLTTNKSFLFNFKCYCFREDIELCKELLKEKMEIHVLELISKMETIKF